MAVEQFRDQTAIAGIGYSRSPAAPGGFSRDSGESVLTLAVRATLEACADAGVEPHDLDGGLMYNLSSDSVPPAQVLSAVGAREINLALTIDGGGHCSSIISGMMAEAVYHGIVKYGLVFRAMNGRSGTRTGQLGGGQMNRTRGAAQWTATYGLAGPPMSFAMQASRYLAATGYGSEDFGAWALFNRGNAVANPRATFFNQPITLDDHQNSRWVAKPYHLLDCCLETDVAVATIITKTEVARDLRKAPVLISSVMAHSGSIEDPAGTGLMRIGPRLLDAAGVALDEITSFHPYDNFSDNPMRQLEDMGWCKRGEAADFIREGRASYDGDVAVATQGGLMNEGYGHGFNNVLEAVQQLRGEAEDLCPGWAEGEHSYDRATCRQVRNPNVAMHASVSGTGGMILRRAG